MNRLRSVVIRVLGPILWIYALGVALVLPSGASAGHEQSWQAALGEAVHQHLIFGRDIVYTYGPLGYLATNAALPATYAAKTIAATIIGAILASLLVLRAGSEGNQWQRVAFGVGSIFVIATVVQVTTIDILLYFALALALTDPAISRKQPNRYAALGLGLFAGIVGLVKFSYCIASLVAGIAALGAIGDVEALALYVAGFGLGSAGIYACVTFGFWPWIIPFAGGVAAATMWRRFGAFALAAAGACVVVLAIFTPYARFFVESWREASEYSAGMAADGSNQDLLAGLFLVAVVVGLAVRERAALGLGRVLVVILMLGLAFKEGFVREDTGHLIVFYLAVGLLACIIMLAAKMRYSTVIAALAVAFTVITSVRLLAGVTQSNVLARVFPTSVVQNLQGALLVAVDWRNRERAFDSGYAAALAPDDLPAVAVAKLRPYPVDLVGNETNVAFANGLEWKPEPVFQPIMAYSPALDLIDRTSLQASVARRELVAYASVDNRYPLGDQPFAYRELLCRDVLDPRIVQPVVTASSNETFLVLQRSTQRCGTETVADAGAVEWGESISVTAPRGAIAFLVADFHYSLPGFVFKTLYHVPPVMMTVDYLDGTSESVRIIPAVARDGMLIDPVPKDVRSLRSLLAGAPVDRVKAVRFSAEAQWYFTDTIGYRVTTVSYAKP